MKQINRLFILALDDKLDCLGWKEKFLDDESDLVFISDLYATLYGGISVNNFCIIPRRAPVSNL